MGKKVSLGHLVYELTEACNQNCRFCYNHWRPGGCQPADSRLARRTLSRILKQAEVGNISFSGGEPTLLKNIHDLALKCRFNGTDVNILTNGTLVSADDIDIFRSIGVSTIQVPLLSGEASVHDWLTGLQGSWERACGTIRNVLEILGPEHFAIVLILTAKNVDGLGRTLEFYRELGVRTVMVNRFNLGGNGLLNRDELCLSGEKLRQAFRLVSDFSQNNPGMDFVSGVCTPICVLDPFDYPGIRFSTCSTDLRNRPLTISYKGDVRFCNHSPFVLGNILERSLKEILGDETLMRRYSGVPEGCAGYKLFSRCKGGCRAASEQVYGTFGRIDPVVEALR
ncbi:MAG: radical SAM protein [Candidatus Cryptobacteroides sp.]